MASEKANGKKVEKEITSRSQLLAARVLHASMNYLKDNGSQARLKEIIAHIEKTVELDEWARATYEETGYVRWESILHFFSIDAVKAGYLLKKRGTWFLTPEGVKATNQTPVELLRAVQVAYRQWKKAQAPDLEEAQESVPDSASSEMNIEKAESLARASVESHINDKNPYEFQEMVGALLRAMGYFTPFVAPKGKDGGVDIIAYRDPIGALAPRIKVQVKHRGQSASVTEIRELMGLLSKDGESGLFISTGGFSPDAKALVRTSHVHVELVDFDRFIELWHDFFEKMPDEDQSMMPLRPVFFVAS